MMFQSWTAWHLDPPHDCWPWMWDRLESRRRGLEDVYDWAMWRRVTVGDVHPVVCTLSTEEAGS